MPTLSSRAHESGYSGLHIRFGAAHIIPTPALLCASLGVGMIPYYPYRGCTISTEAIDSKLGF